MHELGIMFSIIKMVENFAIENNVKNVDTLVLEIGELSPVVPKYIEECYAPATYKTLLENTKLKIEIIPGNGICRQCHKTFNVVEYDGVCPHCKSNQFEVISGKEFSIKEIIAN